MIIGQHELQWIPVLSAEQPVIGKRFLPNGPFSAFFNDFKIFNGPFLIILHRLLWAIFEVNGTMAHGPLPSQSLNNKMFVKHKCPCPHKVQITGLFSKSVTIQAKTLGLVLLWKNKQEMGLDGPVLYYLLQYGNYRQIYWHENSI